MAAILTKPPFWQTFDWPLSNINKYTKLYLSAKFHAFCSKRTIISWNGWLLALAFALAFAFRHRTSILYPMWLKRRRKIKFCVMISIITVYTIISRIVAVLSTEHHLIRTPEPQINVSVHFNHLFEESLW